MGKVGPVPVGLKLPVPVNVLPVSGDSCSSRYERVDVKERSKLLLTVTDPTWLAVTADQDTGIVDADGEAFGPPYPGTAE